MKDIKGIILAALGIIAGGGGASWFLVSRGHIFFLQLVFQFVYAVVLVLVMDWIARHCGRMGV